MKNGKRIDILECIDPAAAWNCYGHTWIPKDHFKLGKQEPSLYYGKEGYCVWNARIGDDYWFKKAFKIVATFVIKDIKSTSQTS